MHKTKALMLSLTRYKELAAFLLNFPYGKKNF